MTTSASSWSSASRSALRSICRAPAKGTSTSRLMVRFPVSIRLMVDALRWLRCARVSSDHPFAGGDRPGAAGGRRRRGDHRVDPGRQPHRSICTRSLRPGVGPLPGTAPRPRRRRHPCASRGRGAGRHPVGGQPRSRRPHPRSPPRLRSGRLGPDGRRRPPLDEHGRRNPYRGVAGVCALHRCSNALVASQVDVGSGERGHGFAVED